MRSSLQIAQAATLRPIAELARELGVQDTELEPYGTYVAKLRLSLLLDLPDYWYYFLL